MTTPGADSMSVKDAIAALAVKGGAEALKQYPAPESLWWSTTSSLPTVTPPTLPIPGDAGDSPKPPVQEVPMLIRTSNLTIPNLPPGLQNIDTGLPFADSQESPDSSHGGRSDGGTASTRAVILASMSSGSTPSSARSSGELPPRPPLRRKNSVKLKKKRKKRKKKKKVTLARVNSRENINEMSMIVEEDENENANTDIENDGTGTEGTPTDGSECTWESGSTGTSDNSVDDGSSNQSSSSCGTPIGNHTTTPTESRNNITNRQQSVLRALMFLRMGVPLGRA